MGKKVVAEKTETEPESVATDGKKSETATAAVVTPSKRHLHLLMSKSISTP